MGLLAMMPTAFLCSLSARVDEHMQQFAYEEEPKKRNPLLRAGMAGGAVVGGVVAGDALSKRLPGIKAGAEAYKVRAKQGAKDAAFKGMRRTAEGMNTAGNRLPKVGADVSAKVGKRLKKGAKFLRKKSMRFFDQGHEFGSDDVVRLLRRSTGKTRRGVDKLFTSAAKGNNGATKAIRKLRKKPISMKDAKFKGDFQVDAVNARAKAGVGSPVDAKRLKRHWMKNAVRKNMKTSDFADLATSLVELEVKLQSL